MNNFWTSSQYQFKKTYLSIDMVNVVLDIEWIRLKYMLEIIK